MAKAAAKAAAAPRRIAAATPGADRVVVVTWADGTLHDIDLGGHAPDSDQAFRAAAVAEDGAALCWPGGGAVPADTLWALGLDQDARRLHRWATRRRLSPAALAEALGLAPATARRYLAGRAPIPRTVKLAMIGYDVVSRPPG